MSDAKVISFRGRVVGTVGGVVDESSATLCIYGETLEPDELSRLLGTQPTEAFRRGSRQGPRSPVRRHGAWLLCVEGRAPRGPEDHIRELLMRPPAAPEVWNRIQEQYRTRIFVGICLSAWNRRFSPSPALLARIAAMGLEIDFDIIDNGEDDDA
jgi:hypothetical protein